MQPMITFGDTERNEAQHFPKCLNPSVTIAHKAFNTYYLGCSQMIFNETLAKRPPTNFRHISKCVSTKIGIFFSFSSK
jgi:hypothetical protein